VARSGVASATRLLNGLINCGGRQHSSGFELWPLIVTDGWIIRFQRVDEFNLFLSDLSLCSSLGFPENFSCDGEAASLVSAEVFSDQITVRATEVVDVVGPVLANVDLSIGIGDLVDDVHRRIGGYRDQASNAVYVQLQGLETSKRSAAG